MSKKVTEVLCLKDYQFEVDGSHCKLEQGKKYPVGSSSYSDDLLVTAVNDEGIEYIVNTLDELVSANIVEPVSE